jgi:putative heme-binding domain-containing protein
MIRAFQLYNCIDIRLIGRQEAFSPKFLESVSPGVTAVLLRWFSRACIFGLFTWFEIPSFCNGCGAGEDVPPFSIPEGFSVQRVADDSLVHDCFCMTLDGLGRPVVSGPGYISTLVDDDLDGKFDRSILWSNLPKQGAQGLWSEGRKLFFVSEGGLWQTEDQNGDLQADSNAKRVLELPTGGEHDAHAIRKGPDGFWYLIAGNFARDISKLQNDPSSPVPRPRSGTIWRISPDFATRSVWAHGMRNCYDFDFLPDGQIVTFDSDCEREASLPWYRPTRVMVLGPGSDAGWCGQSWKDEDHRITMPLTLAQLGRGSPTGVAVYQHRAFPKKYHDAVFALDWTFGRVISIYPSSNLDESQRVPKKIPAEVFLQPTGNAGFAPTDICVGNDGSLLVCVGGRGTSGAIYRVYSNQSSSQEPTGDWFSESVSAGKLNAKQAKSLKSLLTSPMPMESWSESNWRVEADAIGADLILATMSGNISIKASESEVSSAKIRCAQTLTRMNIAVPLAKLRSALTSTSRSTRAAAWWLVGRGRINLTAKDVAWISSLAGIDYESSELSTKYNAETSWEHHLGPADERLRWEAFGLRKWSVSSATSFRAADSDASNSLRRTWLWALARSGAPLSKKSESHVLDGLIAKQLFVNSSTNLDTQLLDALASWVPATQSKWSTRDQLEFLTVLQTALGDRRNGLPQQQDPPQPDVLDGFKGMSSVKLPENVRIAWIGWVTYFAKQALEADSPLLLLEATRTLAMLEPKDKDSLVFLLDQISEKSHPTSDIHWLCCAANCSAPRTTENSRKVADALSGIVRKVKSRGLYTDNQWPIRLQQLVNALLKRDSGLGKAFVELPIPCCPEDIVLLSSFPPNIQADARKKMRAHLIDTPAAEWPIAVLRYASQSGIDDVFAKSIREAASILSMRSVATELLSSIGKVEDYELFLTGLENTDRNQWPVAWKGLNSLPILEPEREFKAVAPVVSSILNSASSIPREAVLGRVRSIAAKLGYLRLPTTESWADWEQFFKTTLDAESFANLYRPQSSVDWRGLVLTANTMVGDPQRGRIMYQEKCGLCHGGQSALGPSLSGVTKRFSRDDLSKAVFEPSRDIPDRYRSIRVLTLDGEIFTGMIIYNAADGTTLQTATGTVIRINQDNIEDKAYSTESLMPSGLLDDKSPTEIADLFAYLSTL